MSRIKISGALVPFLRWFHAPMLESAVPAAFMFFYGSTL
jgi:hypothetical protein